MTTNPNPIPEWLQAGPMAPPALLPTAEEIRETCGDGPEAVMVQAAVVILRGPIDDVTPERMVAWLEKERARLREGTGYDLRTEAAAERPASSEETSG